MVKRRLRRSWSVNLKFHEVDGLREGYERVRGENEPTQGVTSAQPLRDALEVVPSSNEVLLGKEEEEEEEEEEEKEGHTSRGMDEHTSLPSLLMLPGIPSKVSLLSEGGGGNIITPYFHFC